MSKPELKEELVCFWAYGQDRAALHKDVIAKGNAFFGALNWSYKIAIGPELTMNSGDGSLTITLWRGEVEAWTSDA